VTHLLGAGFTSTSRIAGSWPANAKFGTWVRKEGALLEERFPLGSGGADDTDIGDIGGSEGSCSSTGGDWTRERLLKLCESENNKFLIKMPSILLGSVPSTLMYPYDLETPAGFLAAQL
jgi:hypothetical protein